MKITMYILLIIIFGCNIPKEISRGKDEFTKVYTTLCFHSGRYYQGSKQKTYSLRIPKRYTLDNKRGAWHFQRDIYKYEDSLWLYIVNNSWYTPKLNDDNKIYSGVDTRKNFLIDTLYLKGQQKNGKYWKEYIYDDVVIGYINVSEKEKDKFDKAIESLTLVKTEKCK